MGPRNRELFWRSDLLTGRGSFRWTLTYSCSTAVDKLNVIRKTTAVTPPFALDYKCEDADGAGDESGKLTDRSERGSFSETSAGVPACRSLWNLGRRASMSIMVEPRQACQHVDHCGTSAGVPACRSPV